MYIYITLNKFTKYVLQFKTRHCNILHGLDVSL